MIAGNSTFVQKHPGRHQARHPRHPEGGGLLLARAGRRPRGPGRRGYTPNYDYALEALTGIPYGKWREYDAEDTVRFYSLRLHEAGMSKSTPDQIIAARDGLALFRRVETSS